MNWTSACTSLCVEASTTRTKSSSWARVRVIWMSWSSEGCIVLRIPFTVPILAIEGAGAVVRQAPQRRSWPSSHGQTGFNVVEDLGPAGALVGFVQAHVPAVLDCVSVAILPALLAGFLSGHLAVPILSNRPVSW